MTRKTKYIKEVYNRINRPKEKVIDFFKVEQEDARLTYKNIGYIRDERLNLIK